VDVLKVAILPLNAGEGAKPQLGRQISAFVADQLRSTPDADIQSVSFLTQVEQEGVQRTAFVNLSDGMLETDQLSDLFEQSQVDISFDGMIVGSERGYKLTGRLTEKDNISGGETLEIDFAKNESLSVVHGLIKKLAAKANIPLNEAMAGETFEFGTADSEVFLDFLEGYDALNYIQQANGAVAVEFNPQNAFETLTSVIERDPDFLGGYQVIVGLARACATYQIGDFAMVEAALQKATKVCPEEYGAYFALGELYQMSNDLPKAIDFFERASQLEPNDPGILNRLGNAQAGMNMFVNAERNFKRAIELEGPDKPSMDFLAGVLTATGREHEIPGLWKKLVGEDPQNGQAHVKYAMALIQNGKTEEGVKAFEDGLTTLEDNTIVKRYFAPYLAQNDDLDRAMDFYEDCLDFAPADVQLLLEYAQTLQAADRAFEVPEVLKNVLKANPDPNTRAQTNAWLIELEQPKRIESIQSAEQKMEQGDAAGALRELKPLRNWLADYWKLWAMLSSAHNRLGEHAEAEEAAKRLLEMYPGCEPAYGELREALNGQGRHEEAWGFMQWAFSNNQQSFGIFINLGLAAKKAGMNDEAKQIAEQIRAVIDQNPEMGEQLKEVLAEIEA
jgi:tetratricopeptide (TPR) repeat protein